MVKFAAFQGDRATLTKEREAAFALMDGFTEQTARAGKNIFDREDPQYRRYVIYGSPAATATPDLSLSVPGNGQSTAFQGNLDDRTGFRLTNDGPASVLVFVAATDQSPTPADALVLAPGDKDVRALALDLCKDGVLGVLIFRNADAAKADVKVGRLKVVED